MEVVLKYKCSKCGALFDDKEAAEACEAAHGAESAVETFYHQGEGQPYRVRVLMEDGTVAWYRKEQYT